MCVDQKAKADKSAKRGGAAKKKGKPATKPSAMKNTKKKSSTRDENVRANDTDGSDDLVLCTAVLSCCCDS